MHAVFTALAWAIPSRELFDYFYFFLAVRRVGCACFLMPLSGVELWEGNDGEYALLIAVPATAIARTSIAGIIGFIFSGKRLFFRLFPIFLK